MKTIITINLVFTMVLCLVNSAEAVTPSVYCKDSHDKSTTIDPSTRQKISCEILDVQLSSVPATNPNLSGYSQTVFTYLIKYCKDGVLSFFSTAGLNILTNPGSSTVTVPLNSANCRYLP